MTAPGPRDEQALQIVRTAAEGAPRPDWGFICIALATHDHPAAVQMLHRTFDEPPPVPPYPMLGSAALRLARRAGDGGNELLESLWAGLVAHQQFFHQTPGPAAVPGTTIATVPLNSLLTQSDRDLGTIASRLGYNPRPFEAWALQSGEATNQDLWNPNPGSYGSLEMSEGSHLPISALQEATALYAAIPDRARAHGIASRLEDGAEQPPDTATPTERWMAIRGLERYGFKDLAAQVTAETATAVEAAVPSGDIPAAAILLDLQG